jgi:epoxide hydrolase
MHIGDAWAELMRRLGYQRYGAQGGDWGSTVSTALAIGHPEELAGIHLNMVTAFPDRASRGGDLTEQEQAALTFVREVRAAFRPLRQD